MTKFNDEQKQQLAAPLQQKHVSTRRGGGGTLSYIEGWHAIAEANRIFGFDAWTSETVHMECVSSEGGTISYIARVRVTVGDVSREGWGAGHGRGGSPGDRHESAVKEAETDARKRALMTFGNQFGLALYDKEQTNVESTKPTAKRDSSRDNQAVYGKAMAYVASVKQHDIDKAEAYVRASKDLTDEQKGKLLDTLQARR
jgi:DNA repair and recombination protein RAD52